MILQQIKLSDGKLLNYSNFSDAFRAFWERKWFHFAFSVFSIDFPREVRRGETLFTNLIVDETTSKPENNCDDVFVYISDTVEPGMFCARLNYFPFL